MSTEEESKKPESEMGLDLDLHFLPAWAQKSATVNQYEQYSGGEGRRDDRRGGGRDFGNRPPRREGGPRPQGRGPGGPGGFGGQRPGGFGGRPQGDRRREGGPGGPGGRGDRRGFGGGRGPQRGGDRPPPPPIKLPELEVNFFPEEKGVESLARQIKLSGRSYPLFEIAYLVL